MTSSILFPPSDPESSDRLAVSLMRRLANMPGAEGKAVREQLERAAAVVPEAQRPRVLGQLLARAAPDDQVRAVIGVLLLAKTLSDLGWQVEHEPELDGLTPDLCITRDGTTYLVEVQRIIHGSDEKAERMLLQVRDALVGLRTRTPLNLEAVHVPGGTSLRRFRKHVEEILAAPPPKGRQVFEEGDLRIAYEVCPELPHEVDPILSMPIRITYGGAQDQIRKAVLTKLDRYRIPLIVALDLVDPAVRFEAVEDVLLGRRAYSFAFDPEQGAIGEPRAGRRDDGVLRSKGSNGERARNQLVAVLPFKLHGTATDGWEVAARLLANPAREIVHDFAEFTPLPRLVVTSVQGDERRMEYRLAPGSDTAEQDVGSWRHLP